MVLVGVIPCGYPENDEVISCTFLRAQKKIWSAFGGSIKEKEDKR